MGDDKIILYEDDGETFGYKTGECSFTEICTKSTENSVEITVYPRRGNYIGADRKRTFALVRGEKRVQFDVDAQKTFNRVFNIGTVAIK